MDPGKFGSTLPGEPVTVKMGSEGIEPPTNTV